MQTSIPRSRPAMHDMELAGLSAAGDRAAFGELVRRHGSAVRGLLLRMGADPATADDVAQDAFISAFERIAEFRGEGAFSAWVRRIAARLYVKRVRKRLDGAGSLDDTADPGGPGEGEAAVRIDLDGALRALSPVERMCVSMCYGAGLTHVGDGRGAGRAPRHGQVPREAGAGEAAPEHGGSTGLARASPSPPGRIWAMSDAAFERELHRLFGEAPTRPDAELFALRVRERLDLAWAWRRMAVGFAGAGAGAVALWQLGGAQVLTRLADAVSVPASDLWRRTPILDQASAVLREVPVPGELIWLVGGLMLLAAGLVVTRIVDEI